MTNDVWSREEPQSPCVNICVVDRDSRLCIGCFRHISEIAGWGSRPAEERARILEELPARAKAFKPKRKGGRAARSNDLDKR
ncbi:DUF1289 domain-containing protein [Pontivivens insulae]|uniref:Fe-S protein n=1 Tax=Pontivivens insulae TaxID=1639689 RepID=A0A2R8A9Y4_9RHOB|nr:DUF1289 domain-containing protein [Pontivivens insulae]RED12799.1 hypothetical protein DFR53_1929 [Pontivivens insulae]SPF28890.1 hypothetical protein POI8812_01193 [Pontivivens insulae]